MTCKEYRKQVSNCDPHYQTSSTIIAVVKHDVLCRKCRAWRKARSAKINKRLTDSEKLLCQLRSVVTVDRVVTDLNNDPEIL